MSEAELERLRKENEILKGNLNELLAENKNLKDENNFLEKDVNDLCEIISDQKNEIKILINLVQNQIDQFFDALEPSRIIYPYPIEESKDEDFEPLKNHTKYEISRKYNYPIRIKENKYVLKEFIRSGYIGVRIDSQTLMKHVLVALQFLKKESDDQIQVDHHDHNHFNYRIDNLFWKTPSQNQRNKKSYRGKDFEFFDKDDPIFVDFPLSPILKYKNHEFTDYYYSNGNFYYDTKNAYKKLNIMKDVKLGKKGQKRVYNYVQITDNNGKRVRIIINKYQQLFESQKLEIENEAEKLFDTQLFDTQPTDSS